MAVIILRQLCRLLGHLQRLADEEPATDQGDGISMGTAERGADICRGRNGD